MLMDASKPLIRDSYTKMLDSIYIFQDCFL